MRLKLNTGSARISMSCEHQPVVGQHIRWNPYYSIQALSSPSTHLVHLMVLCHLHLSLLTCLLSLGLGIFPSLHPTVQYSHLYNNGYDRSPNNIDLNLQLEHLEGVGSLRWLSLAAGGSRFQNRVCAFLCLHILPSTYILVSSGGPGSYMSLNITLNRRWVWMWKAGHFTCCRKTILWVPGFFSTF